MCVAVCLPVCILQCAIDLFVCELVLKQAVVLFPGMSAIEVTAVYATALSSPVCVPVSACVFRKLFVKFESAYRLFKISK